MSPCVRVQTAMRTHVYQPNSNLGYSITTSQYCIVRTLYPWPYVGACEYMIEFHRNFVYYVVYSVRCVFIMPRTLQIQGLQHECSTHCRTKDTSVYPTQLYYEINVCTQYSHLSRNSIKFAKLPLRFQEL